MEKDMILPQILIAGMEAKFFARVTQTPQDAERILDTAKEWAGELGLTDELKFGYIQRMEYRYEVLVLSKHKGAVGRLTKAGAVWKD